MCSIATRHPTRPVALTMCINVEKEREETVNWMRVNFGRKYIAGCHFTIHLLFNYFYYCFAFDISTMSTTTNDTTLGSQSL